MNKVKYRKIVEVPKEMIEHNSEILNSIRMDMDNDVKMDTIENNWFFIEFLKEEIIHPDNMDEFYIGFSDKHGTIVREYLIEMP